MHKLVKGGMGIEAVAITDSGMEVNGAELVSKFI